MKMYQQSYQNVDKEWRENVNRKTLYLQLHFNVQDHAIPFSLWKIDSHQIYTYKWLLREPHKLLTLTALSLGLKLSGLGSLPARGEGELHKEKEGIGSV